MAGTPSSATRSQSGGAGIDEHGHDRAAMPARPVRVGHRPGLPDQNERQRARHQGRHDLIEGGAVLAGHHRQHHGVPVGRARLRSAADGLAWSAAAGCSSMPSEAALATACTLLLTSSLA